MLYTVEIERWKREVCVVSFSTDTAENAEEQALSLYLGRHLEDDFEDYGKDADIKDEALRVLDDEGEQVKDMPIDSHRNVFK